MLAGIAGFWSNLLSGSVLVAILLFWLQRVQEGRRRREEELRIWESNLGLDAWPEDNALIVRLGNPRTPGKALLSLAATVSVTFDGSPLSRPIPDPRNLQPGGPPHEWRIIFCEIPSKQVKGVAIVVRQAQVQELGTNRPRRVRNRTWHCKVWPSRLPNPWELAKKVDLNPVNYPSRSKELAVPSSHDLTHDPAVAEGRAVRTAVREVLSREGLYSREALVGAVARKLRLPAAQLEHEVAGMIENDDVGENHAGFLFLRR